MRWSWLGGGKRATLRWLSVASVMVVLLAGHVTSVAAATTTSTTMASLMVGPPRNESASGNGTSGDELTADEEWYDTPWLVLKASIMITIIVASIFGNLLVIVSVMRVRKLR